MDQIALIPASGIVHAAYIGEVCHLAHVRDREALRQLSRDTIAALEEVTVKVTQPCTCQSRVELSSSL